MDELSIIENTRKLYKLRYWKSPDDIKNGIYTITAPRPYNDTLNTLETYLKDKFAVFIELINSNNEIISYEGDISSDLKKIIFNNNYIIKKEDNFKVRIIAKLTKGISVSASSINKAKALVAESFFNNEIPFDVSNDLKSINFEIVQSYCNQDNDNEWSPLKEEITLVKDNKDFVVYICLTLMKEVCINTISEEEALFIAHCKYRKNEITLSVDDLHDIHFEPILI